MLLFTALLLLALLGLFVVAFVLANRKLSVSGFRCLLLTLAVQGVLLLIVYCLNDRHLLAISWLADLYWHAALGVSLGFLFPTMGYIWALDRLSFAGRLPHVARAFALSFSGVLLTVISLIGWGVVWFIFLIILQMLGILSNDSPGV